MAVLVYNGETLPAYPVKSTLDGPDNVQHTNVDTLPPITGTVAVSNLPATQPVSAVALPLPDGAATAAKQLPDNHQVTVSNFPAAQAVTVAALPLPSGAATEAKQLADNHQVTVSNQPANPATSTLQTTANNSLSSIDGKVTACNTGDVTVAASALPSGAATAAAQLPDGHNVAVNNFPETQPISAAALPLPAGAATLAKQDSQITLATALNALATLIKQQALTEEQIHIQLKDIRANNDVTRSVHYDYPNNAIRAVLTASNISTVTTVTGVTTVATVTNLAQIGGVVADQFVINETVMRPAMAIRPYLI